MKRKGITPWNFTKRRDRWYGRRTQPAEGEAARNLFLTNCDVLINGQL
jgi:hypothetical protein